MKENSTARLSGTAQTPEFGYVRIDADIQLRRMRVRCVSPKGTVLFVHGFPETIYAWQDIAAALGAEYEVHAFDWPGYGQSSRPSAARFAYAPRDYARVLRGYIEQAGIDRRNLVIYATDIGALPALLAAIDEPGLARRIIVGDFAPFDRPQYMQERLQSMKDPASAEAMRAAFNATRDEILQNVFTRGLPATSHYGISDAFREDLAKGWPSGELTPADAFYHYYSHFTRDQQYFESNLAKLNTPVSVVWGEQDILISKDMGEELASRAHAPLRILAGIGHFPHLQDSAATVAEVRAAFEAE